MRNETAFLIRMSDDEASIIRRAAARDSRSVTAFVRLAATWAAEEILGEKLPERMDEL